MKDFFHRPNSTNQIGAGGCAMMRKKAVALGLLTACMFALPLTGTTAGAKDGCKSVARLSTGVFRCLANRLLASPPRQAAHALFAASIVVAASVAAPPVQADTWSDIFKLYAMQCLSDRYELYVAKNELVGHPPVYPSEEGDQAILVMYQACAKSWLSWTDKIEMNRDESLRALLEEVESLLGGKGFRMLRAY